MAMASASSNSNIIFFFWVLQVLTSFLLSFSDAQMVPAVFVLGDSLVDVGNNNHLPLSITKADFPHNGVDFPTKKPTGRFSNGKNAADFLGNNISLSFIFKLHHTYFFFLFFFIFVFLPLNMVKPKHD